MKKIVAAIVLSAIALAGCSAAEYQTAAYEAAEDEELVDELFDYAWNQFSDEEQELMCLFYLEEPGDAVDTVLRGYNGKDGDAFMTLTYDDVDQQLFRLCN